MSQRFTTFFEFWPFYLQEHARAATRYLHFVGTALALLLLAYCMFTARWFLLLGVPVAGYLFAWLSHAFVERNRPATFTYPAWSLVADFRMFYLWISGGLEKELRKAGVVT